MFLFPGITPEDVTALARGCRGLIVRAYGTGNGPDDIVNCLSEMAAGNVVVGVSTTCTSGGTSEGTYRSALKGNVVYLGNMTAEASFCKLSFLLDQHSDDRVRELLGGKKRTRKQNNISLLSAEQHENNGYQEDGNEDNGEDLEDGHRQGEKRPRE